MKDYLIWLDGGQCIEGTAQESVLNELVSAWTDNNKWFKFEDLDGCTILKLEKVEAIGINNKTEFKSVGFIKED